MLAFCDLAFPNEPSPFHDKRVRTAVAISINRDVICQKILHGGAEPWADLFAPYHPGFDPNLKYPYDPAKAKALLAEAGFPNGVEMTIHAAQAQKLETEAVAADLRKAGIRVTLDISERGIWMRKMHEKKFRGMFQGQLIWAGSTHPSTPLEAGMVAENPWTYYIPPELDAAVKKMGSIVDEEELAAQARVISKLFQESVHRVNLWAVHAGYGLGSKIESYENAAGWDAPANLEYLRMKN
jgi:peptide/nickel transport system substrate-binding protein